MSRVVRLETSKITESISGEGIKEESIIPDQTLVKLPLNLVEMTFSSKPLH